MVSRLATLLAFVVLGGSSHASTDSDAAATVMGFHDVLLEAMQIPQHDQREALLEPQISQLFDLQRIARISLGRTWRSLTAEQQQEFQDTLRILIVATYADRFDGYSGQKFVLQGVASVQKGFVVQTQIQRTSDDPVQLDYYLSDAGIFNVVADGVSDLSLRRADYNSIIKQSGYAALLAHMHEKIDLARGAQ